MSVSLTIGTQGLKNHHLFTNWLLNGYVRPTDSFVRLDKITKKSFIELVQDSYLASVCIALSYEFDVPKSRRINNIIMRSGTFWLSTLYPTLFDKEKKSTGEVSLWVHPEIALNYILGTRMQRRVNKWQKQGHSVTLHSVTPHRGARGEVDRDEYKFLSSFFSDIEVNLLITPEHRFLHLVDDGNYWDLLICFESLTIGFRKKFLKDSKNQVEFDLNTLSKLKFFSDRFYLPLQCLQLLRRKLINKNGSLTMIKALEQLYIYTQVTSLIEAVLNEDDPSNVVSSIIKTS